MSVDQISDRIWGDASFRKAFHELRVTASAYTLGENVTRPIEILKIKNWFHLLRCAAVLLESTRESHHESGLRIVYSALQISDHENVKGYAIALLLRQANLPSVELAISKNLVPEEIIQLLPIELEIEAKSGQIASTISYGSDQAFVGNLFQNQLWSSLESNSWVSASAPTSAGKSFLLEKWIQKVVTDTEESTIFYIVPTRALISQVEKDIRSLLGEDLLRKTSITTLPLTFGQRRNHNIYVYTQERFHLYLLNGTLPSNAELVILDEAHKIGDDTRGILLQQVLELSSKKFDSAKFLFASPSTKNPETLLSFAPTGSQIASISGSTPTVNQNLYWVKQKSKKPKSWDVLTLVDGDPIFAGDIELPNKPSQGQKIAFIAHHLCGEDRGNVLYVNRAADAEDTAELIYQLLDGGETPDKELIALSDFCEKAVHPEFLLRKYLLRGVAFHYGNIPQLVREEVERLFSIGKIKFLICTSTLIEGVNLACKNIFLRHPKRGMSATDLMRPEDFWNLAGRAGRWGKEFQGNIFCIDPLKEAQWFGGEAPREKSKQLIQIASNEFIREFDAFMDYVKTEQEAPTSSNAKFDQLLSYLIFRRTEFDTFSVDAFQGKLNVSELMLLEKVIDEVIGNIKLPIEIINRNPGISPFGMMSLLKYFEEKPIRELESLLPADPLGAEPEDSYVRIFSRITKHLGSQSLGTGGAAFGNAILVINWMQGWPLARIINAQIKHDARIVDRKNAKREKLSPEDRALTKKAMPKKKRSIIRDTMGKVEKIARYEAPKYLHCYLDVLNYHLNQIGREDLKEEISDIWMFLEFGVSKRTQLSLISIGMSRSSVMTISEKISDSELDEEGVYKWLVDTDWQQFGFPELVEFEINKILKERTDLVNS